MKLNFSLDAALMITVITALLYLVAQLFLASYISLFGADITVLNLTIQDKLYYGFLKSLKHTLYFSFSLFMLFIALPSIFKDLGGTKWLQNQLREIRAYVNKDTKHQPIINNTALENEKDNQFSKKLLGSYIFLMLLVGSIYYLSYTEKEARERAIQDLKSYKLNLTQIKINDRPNQEAYKILCSQNLCAVLIVHGKEKELLYIDPKNISFPLKSLIK